MKVVDPDPLLTGPQCAERIDVQASTWRSLVRGGYAPEPEVPGKWRASVVDAWQAARPGRGQRTGRRYVVPFSGELG